MCILDLSLSFNRIFTGFHSCEAEEPSEDEDTSACTYRAELKLQALYGCKCKDCFSRVSERVPKRDGKISWITTLVPGRNCNKGQINPTDLELQINLNFFFKTYSDYLKSRSIVSSVKTMIPTTVH